MEWESLTCVVPALKMLVALGLRSSGPFQRWRWPSGILKGRDLGEELVVQTLHLLFTGRISSIIRRLLQLAAKQGLLLRHLLHVSKHLELGFVC